MTCQKETIVVCTVGGPSIRRYPDIRRSKSLGATGEQ